MSIGNQLVFDINGNVEDFIFILSTKDFRHLGALQNVISDSVHNSGNLMSPNDISFEVYKTFEKEVDEEAIFVEEPLWDEIDNLKLVYVRELNEYFEMEVQLDDTTDVVKKTVTCTSLCESELGQLGIHGLEVNTETDISRPDYEPTIFYNPTDISTSLLDRVVSSFAPNYTIKHVDKSLWNIQRTFSVDGTYVYDWFMGECSKEFNCLFMFDSAERGIYVYDLFTVCEDCGHRGDYLDVCPKCGSTNLSSFGEDTGIYIDKENLTDAIQFTTDKDSIKSCFKLETGDDILTAMVKLINPNGSLFIYKPTDKQLEEMPKELRDKLVSYNELYLSKQVEYEGILADIFEAMGEIDKLTHTMMPSVEYKKATAQTEADKLNSTNLDLLGLSKITSPTNPSKSTIELALVNYAKTFVNTGVVKLSINNGTYTYIGVDSDGWNYGTWTGNFKVENYTDKKDIAYSPTITVKVTEDYGTFIEQKILKNISDDNSEKDSAFDVLSIEDLNDFKEALKLYCLKRLQSFYDAIQTALTTLLELNQSYEDADYYEEIYLPYYEKLKACQVEINIRQEEISTWKTTYDELILLQEELQTELNFETHLGEDLYRIYNMYRREDTYRNDNYSSEGLTDSEQIKKAKEFYEVANQELEKARTPKLSISTTLYNLLLILEFKPLIHNFKLGNWLRICVDDVVYRIRLVGYRLSFSSIQTLEVTFSNIAKINTVKSKNDELLDLVKSMGSTYDYYSSQAKKGNEANVEINNWLEKGLNSALVNIKNNNNEDPILDKHGIWGRAYDSVTGNILPEQFRATHNILAFTTDGFKTVKAALGKHNYYKFDEAGNLVQDTAYGLSCDFVTSGTVYGSQIIGGDIYSENYKVDANGNVVQGSHLALKTGGFSFGGIFEYDPISNKISLKETTIQWSSSTAPEISDINGLETSLSTALEKAEQGIQKGLEGINLANNAKTYAEGVDNSLSTEITNRINADNKLSTDITNAYKSYTDSKISSLDKSVADYLGVGGGTLITEKGVISPYIAGGYLNITNTSNNSRVIIDPNNLTGNEYIFQVHNGSQVTVGIKSSGDAVFNGTVYATDGEFTGTVTTDYLTANVSGNIAGWTIATDYLGSYGAVSNSLFLSQTGKSAYINALGESKDCYIYAKGNFAVDTDGTAYMKNAKVDGVLTAGIGSSLGGFKVDYNSIFSGEWDTANETAPTVFLESSNSANNYYSIAGHRTNTWALGAGKNFGVTLNGDMYANSGRIGAWNIYTTGILGSAAYATVNNTTGYYGIGLDANVSTDTSLKVLAIGQLGDSNTTTEENAVNGTWGNAAFYVTAGGSVVANDLTTSNITATGGKIGNWSINTSTGALEGFGSDGIIRLFPKGERLTASNGTTYTFYFVIYHPITNQPYGGITIDGWQELN